MKGGAATMKGGAATMKGGAATMKGGAATVRPGSGAGGQAGGRRVSVSAAAAALELNFDGDVLDL